MFESIQTNSFFASGQSSFKKLSFAVHSLIKEMAMNMEQRFLKIEGQIQALARAWLHLAAISEEAGNHEPEQLENSLLATQWSGHPVEPYAHRMLQHMLADLADARENRKQGRLSGSHSN
jgi:hypothetical protein